MEVQVSKKTEEKVSNMYQSKEFVTRKDVPDIDCKYVGRHLQHSIIYDKGYNATYQNIKTNDGKELGVIYNSRQYSTNSLLNRVKKIKY